MKLGRIARFIVNSLGFSPKSTDTRWNTAVKIKIPTLSQKHAKKVGKERLLPRARIGLQFCRCYLFSSSFFSTCSSMALTPSYPAIGAAPSVSIAAFGSNFFTPSTADTAPAIFSGSSNSPIHIPSSSERSGFGRVRGSLLVLIHQPVKTIKNRGDLQLSPGDSECNGDVTPTAATARFLLCYFEPIPSSSDSWQ